MAAPGGYFLIVGSRVSESVSSKLTATGIEYVQKSLDSAEKKLGRDSRSGRFRPRRRRHRHTESSVQVNVEGVRTLSVDGTVVADLQVRPWGDSDGQVRDKFGLPSLIGFEPGK
jgi:hypothetical protein